MKLAKKHGVTNVFPLYFPRKLIGAQKQKSISKLIKYVFAVASKSTIRRCLAVLIKQISNFLDRESPSF